LAGIDSLIRLNVGRALILLAIIEALSAERHESPIDKNVGIVEPIDLEGRDNMSSRALVQ
jgi:hypothetical protein